MKKVLNLSLGSSKRNFTACFELAGEKVLVQRIGVEGDVKSFKELLRSETDFHALAIGGINADYHFGDKSWPIPQYIKLVSGSLLPVYDGAWVKTHYEIYMLEKILSEQPGLVNKRWLVFSTLDRYKCFRYLRDRNINAAIGDAYAALGLPIFPNELMFKQVAKIFMPLFVNMPLSYFYPHQQQPKDTRMSALNSFDVILSETNFLLHKKPLDLTNKTLILSRCGDAERHLLSKKDILAVHSLLPGEILSANIIEAMVALTIGFKKQQQDIFKGINNIKRLD